MQINWEQIKSIHFVGIKGVAMTALAIYGKERGYRVIGSDVNEEFPTDELLRRAEITVLPGFNEGNLENTKPDLVIFTGAHGGRNNPEVKEAIRLNIPIVAQGQALGEVMSDKKQISVAGCHGKTTTSAMLATILTQAKLDPSYAVGCGEIFSLGLPGHYGRGQYFVVEADEYVTDPGHDATPRFLWQTPYCLVVTNIDYDHPDVYQSLVHIQLAYRKLRQKVSRVGKVIVNADDKNSEILLLDQPQAIRVGTGNNVDYQITNIRNVNQMTTFTLQFQKKSVGQFKLKIPGRHNVSNAALAAVAARSLDLRWEEIITGLAQYRGSKRRFERVGSFKKAMVYDDYAHHPAEIAATLAAARTWYPKGRLITVFQPHTFSRTYALLVDFVAALAGSDLVIVSDIYASAREKTDNENPGILAETIIKQLGQKAQRGSDFLAVKQIIEKEIKPNDIVIFMGAGSIYHWSHKLVRG